MTNILVDFSDFKSSEHYGLLEIVELSAEICRAPVATLTFSEGQGHIITFNISGEITSKNSNQAFARKVIEEEKPFIIKDIEKGLCLNDLALMKKNSGRFYIGVPIKQDNGAIIGSLCVFDLISEQVPYKQLNLLHILSKQITTVVESGQDNAFPNRIYNAKALKENAFSDVNNSESCYYLFNKHMKLDAFNKPAEKFAKKMLRVELTTGMRVIDHLNDSNFFRCSFLEAFSGKLVKTEFKSRNYNNGIIKWEVICGPVFNTEGVITGVFYNTADIVQKKETEHMIMSASEALEGMAFMLTHELRKPVANIIGLINLINLNDYGVEDKQFLKMLLQLTSDLDEKIKTTVSKINYLVA